MYVKCTDFSNLAEITALALDLRTLEVFLVGF